MKLRTLQLETHHVRTIPTRRMGKEVDDMTISSFWQISNSIMALDVNQLRETATRPVNATN